MQFPIAALYTSSMPGRRKGIDQTHNACINFLQIMILGSF